MTATAAIASTTVPRKQTRRASVTALASRTTAVAGRRRLLPPAGRKRPGRERPARRHPQLGDHRPPRSPAAASWRSFRISSDCARTTFVTESGFSTLSMRFRLTLESGMSPASATETATTSLVLTGRLRASGPVPNRTKHERAGCSHGAPDGVDDGWRMGVDGAPHDWALDRQAS